MHFYAITKEYDNLNILRATTDQEFQIENIYEDKNIFKIELDSLFEKDFIKLAFVTPIMNQMIF